MEEECLEWVVLAITINSKNDVKNTCETPDNPKILSYLRKKGSLILSFWSMLGLGGVSYMFLSVFSDFEFILFYIFIVQWRVLNVLK